jgi:Ni,Fe-hydrogenase I small subunit
MLTGLLPSGPAAHPDWGDLILNIISLKYHETLMASAAGKPKSAHGGRAQEGWCLYELGCKGPDTHAGCSTRHFKEIPDVWPIGIGAQSIGW